MRIVVCFARSGASLVGSDQSGEAVPASHQIRARRDASVFPRCRGRVDPREMKWCRALLSLAHPSGCTSCRLSPYGRLSPLRNFYANLGRRSISANLLGAFEDDGAVDSLRVGA